MNAFQKANYIFEGKDPEEINRIIASAIVMGELVFKHRNSLHPAHVREFLRIVLSKITEAEPKDKKRTRYCSLDAFRKIESVKFCRSC
jgi:hypothetical protein